MTKTHNESNTKTKAGTRLYRIWAGILSRCTNENRPCYSRYGGRGIDVCEGWKKSYLSFKQWAISSGYKDSLSIDRIDNDKGYDPINCKWSTVKEQARNRSSFKLPDELKEELYKDIKFRILPRILAKKYNISREYVTQFRKQLGMHKQLSVEDYDRIVELVVIHNMSTKAVSELYNVCQRQVVTILTNRGCVYGKSTKKWA